LKNAKQRVSPARWIPRIFYAWKYLAQLEKQGLWSIIFLKLQR
jgi:hypothetical protein